VAVIEVPAGPISGESPRVSGVMVIEAKARLVEPKRMRTKYAPGTNCGTGILVEIVPPPVLVTDDDGFPDPPVQ
jgi:hypothetical protein